MEEFIVYACPVGALAEQVEAYLADSLARCGPNQAHHYMPHCTLTGFFRDDPAAIPRYSAALQQAWAECQPTAPDPVIQVVGMTFHSDWHGLELRSPWLQQLVVRFAQRADSPTRSEALRLKDWLHLSLAYGFAPEQAERLRSLAETWVHPTAPVAWELRFYQRCADGEWICHQALELGQG